ncbi:MAG: hypothetical protein AMXMBFR84_40280 [Candidatus Hydrogenedentota bacterium]
MGRTAVKDRSYKKRKRIRNKRWDESTTDTVTRESRSKREDSDDTLPDIDIDAIFTACETNALVISPYGLLAFVERNGEEQLCRVDDRLTDGRRSILAPGDLVCVVERGDESFVEAVRTRTSKISRPYGSGGREKTLAANIDTAVIVAAAAEPAFRPGLVDRYLIASAIGGVQPVLCVNKMDLVDIEPPEVGIYRELGIEVVNTCCKSGMGLDTLRTTLFGKTVVLTGHSGVGKSSLLNALDPALEIETQDVSRHTQKGRHTTTSSRLYSLNSTTRIIDTPGIRQMGLWNVEPEQVNRYFHEIAEAGVACKFRDCTHTHEPACAVREAVASGAVTDARYRSYLRIRESLMKDDSNRTGTIDSQFRMPGPRSTGA